LEDFVDHETYRLAVNEQLRRSGRQPQIARGVLPRDGRVDALRTWCATQKIPPPDKPLVAYQILEYQGIRALVDGRRSRRLAAVYGRLRKRLRIDEAQIL
jgi:hypothetical protein